MHQLPSPLSLTPLLLLLPLSLLSLTLVASAPEAGPRLAHLKARQSHGATSQKLGSVHVPSRDEGSLASNSDIDADATSARDAPKAHASTFARCWNEAAFGPIQEWPVADVSTLGGPSHFGWVVTQGTAVTSAETGTKACFTLRARTRNGSSFDQGAQQNALFMVRLTATSASPRLALNMRGDVAYVPEQSGHCMCFTAPAPGTYRMQVRLVYTNAGKLLGCTNPEQGAAGFARYKPVLTTKVHVLYKGQRRPLRNVGAYRKGLPLCTTQILASTFNAGFWYGNMWYPSACRLTRLPPSGVLRCLNGKNVLVMGDSQSRLFTGVLRQFLAASSRGLFFKQMSHFKYYMGDFVGSHTVPVKTSQGGKGPPMKDGEADTLTFPFLDTLCSYYGGVYQGFAKCNFKLKDQGRPIAFNLTFSSCFKSAAPLFSRWKLTGALTEGAKVATSGDQFDMVFQANQIHDMSNFTTVEEYSSGLKHNWLPSLKGFLKDTRNYILFGAFSMIEDRNHGSICLENAMRRKAFAAAARTAMLSQGFPNFLSLDPVTWPRPDLAFDSIHYTWPASLAVMDLWLGSTCPSKDYIAM